jgi:hypothetical protein
MRFLNPPYVLFISHPWGRGEYRDERDRLITLLERGRGASFDFRDISVTEDDPLLQPPPLSKSNRTLVYQLDDRISKADCVLVLSGMYCAYSEWIQSEIEAAKAFRKPIIGIIPWGQKVIPEAVEKLA